jgi:ribonuclease PH
MRKDGRAADELRPFSIETGYLKDPEGCALVKAGQTWVLCTASVEEKVPPYMKDSGKGWVTAEYAMLPRATNTRGSRGSNGRAKEIERLIGRSLRAAVDLAALGPRTITVDCDVLQADGGTRTAAITGGYVALALACRYLERKKGLKKSPLRHEVAAISVGIVEGEVRLDLPYVEDSVAEVDMNVVMTGHGAIVEVQGTAEAGVFSRAQMDAMVDVATRGIERLVTAQRAAIERVV